MASKATPMTSEEFMAEIRKNLQIGNRFIQIHNYTLGYGTVWIRYVNLPSCRTKADAESENNTVRIHIDGFSEDKDGPGVAKVSIRRASAYLNRQTQLLPGKSSNPQAIAKYVADFLNQIAADVRPNYTHTSVSSLTEFEKFEAGLENHYYPIV
jgi:hypothetical protein